MRKQSPQHILALVLSIVMLLALCPPGLTAGFSDVQPEDWFQEAVEDCVSQGLMVGTGEGFDPYGTVTKEQVIQTLYQLAGKPGAPETAPFTDMDPEEWYAPALLWAKAAGLAAGIGDGSFGVGAFVTRQELASFLFRYAGEVAGLQPEAPDGLDIFPDREDVAPWALGAVCAAVSLGIVSGQRQEDGSLLLKPLETAQRCELASILSRFARVLREQPPEPTEPVPTEEPTESVPAEYPTEPVPTEEPTEPVPTEEPTEPVPTEEPTEPVPTEPLLQAPQIYITTADGTGITLQKEDGYVSASIRIIDVDGSVLEDEIELKVRGNSTALTSIQKKAFAFKLSKKRDVLGLGKGKKWVLLANAFDPTLLRNAAANELAHGLELEYTSNRTFVELWLDGSYRGCYDLYVPVQAKPERIDLDVESDGGLRDFLIEYEYSREDEDETYFKVSGLRFCIKAPEDPNEEQVSYVADTVQRILNTLRTGTQEEIEQVIDVDSFAKFYLLNEFLKTLDFDMSSVFYYYKAGILYAGPAWDFDLSTGNISDKLTSTRCREARDPTGLYAAGKNLYRDLTNKSWFAERAKELFRTYDSVFCGFAADGGLLDSLLAAYAPIFEKNYAPGVWSVSRYWINYQKRPLGTYEENYEYLKDWCAQRYAWMAEYCEVPSKVP